MPDPWAFSFVEIRTAILIDGSLKFQELKPEDFYYETQQKGVDIKPITQMDQDPSVVHIFNFERHKEDRVLKLHVGSYIFNFLKSKIRSAELNVVS